MTKQASTAAASGIPIDEPQEDNTEAQEWIEALDSVVQFSGRGHTRELLKKLNDHALISRVDPSFRVSTPYRNTIALSDEKPMPGDLFMERRIRSLIRWNALAMVLRANGRDPSLGGHISTFSSIATLYDVGFNYFFRGDDGERLGDLIYFQGHSSPGIYARSFLEGRLSEEQMDNFRREVGGNGLSSYPHPRLMEDYWQFPTVSMGLAPIQAIYQAYLMKYQSLRGLVDHGDRKIWCFVGDGECDEPESLGCIGLAGREQLDNLIFVVNCNLQRLDGPVRGNGKIIQELEGAFRGAGWHVLKVVWGRRWDPLLQRDEHGLLQKRMDETVDGDFQNYKFSGGDYTRKHFFGKYPELEKLVADLSDEDIFALNRGGHDPFKVYAAYSDAVSFKGKPTVILAKTVKGYGMGQAGEADNDTHSLKKLSLEELKQFRDRFDIPIPDGKLAEIPYYRPPADSHEMVYMRNRRKSLGGPIPVRHAAPPRLQIPDSKIFAKQLEGSGEREVSTTMALVRMLSGLIRDKSVGEHVLPIVPDEARTFGMEGMFNQCGIFSSSGQLYTPVDAGQLIQYRESRQGQIIEAGLNEAGAFSAWLAAATSYSSNRYPMLPFYIFYSMFGFQRVGDLIWAAGDMQARGFLIGATAGRTTLNGEGLQHQDGHSLPHSQFVPNCRAYDPAYAYEMAVIISDGMKRMFKDGENCFYYLTAMNENYVQPPLIRGAEEGIIRGLYQVAEHTADGAAPKVQLLGSGTILREALAAAELLVEDFGVSAQTWSVTSYSNLYRDGIACERWNMLHPGQPARQPWIQAQLEENPGPVIAVSDYVRAWPELVRAFIPGRFRTLGTDGFGRSDTRPMLRRFFEVDRHFIVLAALQSLVQEGNMQASQVQEAMRRYEIDPDKLDPLLC